MIVTECDRLGAPKKMLRFAVIVLALGVVSTQWSTTEGTITEGTPGSGIGGSEGTGATMDGATLPLPLPLTLSLPITLPCRDRFLEPFSSASIWNTAIGSAAQFSAAHLFNDTSNLPSQFHNDQVSPCTCVCSRGPQSLARRSL